MAASRYFISCDWGTSNFRLKLVEVENLEVITEIRTSAGVKALYHDFSCQKEMNQSSFFAHYLNTQIEKLPPAHKNATIVISGMASSNIGLHELEYCSMPISMTGENLNYQAISIFEKKALLISGVKSPQSIMRGEETQALGLVDQFKSFKAGVLLLPGTHSKHIRFENHQFTGLKTFMTGEIFDLLSKQSILSNNVEAAEWSERTIKAYQDGVSIGLKANIFSELFYIRAGQLLHNTEKSDNYFRLSGMLIGNEISYLKEIEDMVFLSAEEPLLSYYKHALEIIKKEDQVIFFDQFTNEKAILRGQRIILKLYEN